MKFLSLKIYRDDIESESHRELTEGQIDAALKIIEKNYNRGYLFFAIIRGAIVELILEGKL